MTDRTLAKTELHTLIGTEVSWSDALWSAAVTFLMQSLNASEIEETAEYVGWQRPNFEAQRADPISDFSFLPLTVMLGIYVMRRHNIMVEMVLRDADREVESGDLNHYSIDVG